MAVTVETATICQERNAYNWNRKQLQTLSALASCYWKDDATHRKSMTTVKIPEWILLNEDVKIPRSSLWFSLATGLTLKKNCGSRISLRRSIGVAQGPLQRGARLAAIGQRPALVANAVLFKSCLYCCSVHVRQLSQWRTSTVGEPRPLCLFINWAHAWKCWECMAYLIQGIKQKC